MKRLAIILASGLLWFCFEIAAAVMAANSLDSAATVRQYIDAQKGHR